MMDQIGEKSNNNKRPIRNKRFINRKSFHDDEEAEDKRPPPKRLFTPEIKRYLKDWLIRRRENPYPNRDEKKLLAIQTGLTYIQVCNWFANWRRKLKNASNKETQEIPQISRTWGELIKTYNHQVQGNVEHFSINSDNSIWEEESDEEEEEDNYYSCDTEEKMIKKNHYNKKNPFAQSASSSNKYKNHIMEKYMKDCANNNNNNNNNNDKSSMITKWLKSAERFRPNEDNFIDWTFNNKPLLKKKHTTTTTTMLKIVHGKEELDAAEALTSLANSNSSSRFKE